LFFGLLVTPSVAFEDDECIIQGMISDQSAKPLIGANVMIENTGYGSSSYENGVYYLALPDSVQGKEVVLVVQYMGYISKSQNLKLTTAKTICDFQLEIDVLSLRPIVVSAQRRVEDLQKVPISITSVSAEEMQDRGAERIIDLQYSVPNLYMGTGETQSQIYTSIRGISGYVRTSGGEARASYYIDDVYVGRTYAVNRDLIDLEQVETLRGPQGTLYGKNTVSGAVNYTTKKPHGNWESTLGFNTGNFNYVNAYTIINAPLVSNKLFARFSGKISTRDGYLKNLYNNKDMNGWHIINGRFQLRYLPDSALDITLRLHGLRERRDRSIFGIATEGDGFDAAPDPREVSHDAGGYAHRDIYGGALTVSYLFSNNYSLKSITAYQKVKAWSLDDQDLSPQYIAISESVNSDYQLTQEFRFSTPINSNFNFITGLFYFYQKTNMELDILAGPDFTFPNIRFYSDGPVTTNSLAGYFSCNYTISSKISLTGGIRYTYEYKKINWMAKNEPEPIVFIDVPNFRDTYSQGELTPRFSISYFPNSNILLYGSISRGYTSGGWSNGTVSSLEHLKYKPEFVTSYEIGSKLLFFKNRLKFNASVFFERFRDFQDEMWRDLSTGENTIYFTNAAKVTSKGFEMELSAVPWKNLKLSAALGYTDARYDEYKNGGGVGIHFDGHRLENAPETEYSFTVGYQRPIDRLGIIKINADFIHKDSFYTGASNRTGTLVPGYELLNGRIGFQTIGHSFSVYLWGKNLTDKVYMLYRSFVFLGFPFAWYAIPRTFGISLEYKLFN